MASAPGLNTSTFKAYWVPCDDGSVAGAAAEGAAVVAPSGVPGFPQPVIASAIAIATTNVMHFKPLSFIALLQQATGKPACTIPPTLKARPRIADDAGNTAVIRMLKGATASRTPYPACAAYGAHAIILSPNTAARNDFQTA